MVISVKAKECTEVVLGTTDLTSIGDSVNIGNVFAGIEGGVYYPQAAYNKRSTMLRTYLTGLLVWGLSSTGLAQAPQTTDAVDNEPAVEFSLGGYYQTRYKSFTNFFEPVGGGQAVANPSIMTHRLKLEPTFAFGDLAKLSLDIDAMNGVLWGDNAGLASTALFAGNPSDTTSKWSRNRQYRAPSSVGRV